MLSYQATIAHYSLLPFLFMRCAPGTGMQVFNKSMVEYLDDLVLGDYKVKSANVGCTESTLEVHERELTMLERFIERNQ